jgi:DNA repair exonuclease SbcCD ATPase subunit
VKAEREAELARVAKDREAERARLTRDREEERSRVARERVEERESWNKQKELLGERLVNAEAGVESEERTRKRLEKEVAVLKREKDDISRSVPPLQELVTTMRQEMAKTKELVATREKNEAALERQLAVLRREKAELSQAVAPLQQLATTLKEEATKSKELAETRQRDVKSLEEELRRLGEQREASLALKDAHINSVNAALRDAKEELTKVRSSVDERTTQAGSTIAHLKQKLAQCYQLENERSDRVVSDQMKRQASDIRFGGGAEDRKGYAEPVDAAINVLYTLNSEIFQAAASFADSVEMETKPEVQLEELELLIAKMAPVLSRDLITSLRSAYTEPTDVPNPLLLQVAFQACVAYCCNRFITSWYPLHWDYGNFLQILHSRILETGKSPFAYFQF